MINLTEAIEQFRVDHPEYAENMEALRIAEIAIVSYQRAMQLGVFSPFTLKFDKLNSVASWKVCGRCGGRGWINVTTYPDFSSTAGTMSMHTEGCPACNGRGGYFE